MWNQSSQRSVSKLQDGFNLTILFNIVIRIVVSISWGHLRMKRWSTFAYKLAHLSNKQKKDSLGSLWDCWTKGHETWRDVSGLQCIGHPVSTRQNTPDKSRHRCSPAAGSQLERWKGHCNSIPDYWHRSLLTLEYCILSTMSSLVSGMRPDNRETSAQIQIRPSYIESWSCPL